jgi:hypothetical protein
MCGPRLAASVVLRPGPILQNPGVSCGRFVQFACVALGVGTFFHFEEER